MEQIIETLGPACAGMGLVTGLTGAAAIYYMSRMPDPTCIPPIDLKDQSHVLEVRHARC